MNNIEMSVALATAPSTAFAELRERPRFWFPLLLVTLATAGIVYWYYSVVDIDWLKDIMFSNNPEFQKLPEAQRAATTGMLTRTTILWSSLVAALIAIPVFTVVQALFLWLAAKVTKVPLGFKHWFSLVSWASIAGLIGLIVAAILMLLSDNAQISPGTLSALSVNELLVNRPVGSPGEGLLTSLNIPGFLSWALLIIGVHTWSQRSWAFSAAFVLVPIAVIYAVWAFVAFK
jgi:hypothetical protein